MKALLTTYSSVNWPQLVSALGGPDVIKLSLTADEALSPIQSIADLDYLLSQSADAQFYIAVVQAEYFIAEAIDKQENLAVAAKQWREQTQALLDFQRHHRHQLQLFNLHQALNYPDIFIEKINYSNAIPKPTKPTYSNELSLLAACQYVDQRTALKSLNTRLLAITLPLAEEDKPWVDIESVLQGEKLKQKNLLDLQKNLDEIQIELNVTTKSKALQTEVTQLRGDLTKLKIDGAVITKERDLILAQLHQVQEKVEEYYVALKSEEQKNKHTTLARDKQYAKEIQKLENELRKANARAASAEYNLGLLHKELSEHKNSTLWKATGPVRLLGGLVRRVDKSKEKLQQDIGLLLTSDYFDVEWYLRHYPDVAESKMNPAEHYLLYGAAEGRLPGPLFDGNWYLQQYPDVADAGINPLLHLITHGLQEGRNSSPKFLLNSQANEDAQ